MMHLSALPPLPELFGNPVLRGFNEIVATAEIVWLPQAPGWYVLGTLLAIWSIRVTWRGTRLWWRNRYRREAIRALSMAGSAPAPTAVNEVLKLAAMSASSRAQVAALTGQVWIDWLNSRVSEAVFSAESLQLLGHAQYEPNIRTDQMMLATLAREAQRWLYIHKDDHGPA